MAAGLGFKTFTTGEVLTAADTNGYLMQGVLVFASAAARDAAITSPQEGQCCYLKDTDAVLTYSGAAWVGFDDSNAIQNTIVDAKGDLITATAADTPARLAVGTNGQTLVADSAEATGLKWATPSAGGKLLQVVSATTTTSTAITSLTYTDTTITATITPTLSTSKIFVMISSSVRSFRQGDGPYTDAKLLRGATSLTTWTDRYFMGMDIDTSGTENNLALVGQPSITYMDSPASTSALTYKLQAAVYTTSASSSVTFQIGSSRSTITLFEIGA